MTRKLDTPLEKTIMKAIATAATDPTLAKDVYRLVNDTPLAYFPSDRLNKIRQVVQGIAKEIKEIEQ